MGLKKNPRHAAFNRLAMYNNTDLKRFEEALKAADVFFNECDKADYSYLDYMYYGHLLEELKKYDEAVGQYEKAVELDPTKTDLYKNISSAYEQKMIIKKRSVHIINITRLSKRKSRLLICSSSWADFIMVQVRNPIR